MDGTRGAIAGICAGFLILASCKMPLITSNMIVAAKDSSGLTTASANKSISLSWVPDPTAASYTLRYTANGTLPTASNGITIADARPPVALSNLVNGNPYAFSLEALYADGSVKLIGQEKAIPLSDRTLAPTVSADGAYLRVRWPVIAGSDKFRVYRKEGEGGEFALRAELSGNEFLDTSVLPNAIYSYAVEASSGSAVRSMAGSGRSVIASAATDVLESADLFNAAPSGMHNALRKVAVDSAGRYAYVGVLACPNVSGAKPYEAHVLVLDMKSAGLPVVGRLQLPTVNYSVEALAVSGNYLFAVSAGTIYMYDIGSLPSAGTTPISSWAVPGGSLTDLCVKDNRLYVTGGKQLNIVGFSAAGLSGLGSCSLAGNPGAVVVQGNYAFTYYCIYTAGSGYTTYVDRIDVSNPNSIPAPSGGYSSSTYGLATCMALAYPYLYIDGSKDSAHSIVALDISQPSTFTVAGSFAAFGCTRKMAAFGSYLVSTEQPTGMRTFSVPSIAGARSEKTINLPSNDPRDFCMVGNRALVLDSDSSSYAIASLVDPGVGGGTEIFSESGVSGVDTAVSGNRCYSLEYLKQNPDTYRLTEYDISDCESIAKRREISLPFIATQLAVSGGYAIIAEFTNQAGRLRVLDLGTEELLPPGPATGMIKDISLYGSYAFVSEGVRGVDIVDASDPRALAIVAKISTPGVASKVSFSGSYAYVAMGNSGLGVYDIRDPARPMLLQIVGGMDKAQDVAICGSYAYVADYQNLRVVNVADPRSAFVKVSLPFTVPQTNPPDGVHKIAIAGSRAAVDVLGLGLSIVDITLPERPSVIGTIPDTVSSADIVASGSYLFTTAGRGYPPALRILALKVF